MSASRGRVVPKRQCDICGRFREALPGVFSVIKNRWTCNYHGFIPAEELDRTPYKTFEIRPLKDARPFDYRDTFARAEEEIFTFLVTNVGTDYVDTTVGGGVAVVANTLAAKRIGGAAWTGIYLADIITENKRPTGMVIYARSALKSVAAWLLGRMLGGPHVTTYTSADPQWGAFDQYGRTTGSFTCYLRDAGAAGLALLRAYQVLGTQSYLDGARAVAWFIRNAQCGHLIGGWSSSLAAAGTPHYFGAFPRLVDYTVGTAIYSSDHYYTPGELVCAEFLNALKAQVGDETIGSSTVSGPFTASRAALISTSIADTKTFWTAGVLDATQSQTVNGFSTATPFAAFNAFPAFKLSVVGTGSWEYQDGDQTTGTSLTALEWAAGIRALRAIDGDSALVTGLFDWLMTFTSNATYQLPTRAPNRMVSGYDDKFLWGGAAGTYAPATAPATLLKVRENSAAVKKNGSSLYDLAALGLLAPLYSSRQLSTFRDTKEALDEPRPCSFGGAQDGRFLMLGPLGACGLSLQPYTDASLNRKRVVQLAAMTGLIYRQAPFAFMGRGH